MISCFAAIYSINSVKASLAASVPSANAPISAPKSLREFFKAFNSSISSWDKPISNNLSSSSWNKGVLISGSVTSYLLAYLAISAVNLSTA